MVSFAGKIIAADADVATQAKAKEQKY